MIISKDTHKIYRFFYSLCFIDHSLKGVSNAVLGLGREKIPCDEIYCVYGNPNQVMKEFALKSDITIGFIVIFLYMILFNVIAYVLIRFRLKNAH
jgi:hypothetical protein